jgi:hypothetical protein
MLGPTKLSTIRAEVRKVFQMSDAELFAWFNRQMEELGQQPKADPVEMDTLRLLRDALLKEVKRDTRRRRGPRLTGRSQTWKRSFHGE